jgi:hypothetical protein
MNERLADLSRRLTEQFEAMTARDRLYAMALGVMLAVLFTGGITYFLHGILEDSASRVRAAKENLAQVEELSAKYQALQVKIDAAEQRMGQFRTGQVNTYLETWAGTAGVLPGLKQVKPGETQTVGDYKESEYRVDLQNADLDGVVRFLYAIETSPYPIRIKAAQFSVSGGSNRFIDLGLELLTYEKEGGG